MPVILGESDREGWLVPDMHSLIPLQSMLALSPDYWLECAPE